MLILEHMHIITAQLCLKKKKSTIESIHIQYVCVFVYIYIIN